jgi:hypothetical protein
MNGNVWLIIVESWNHILAICMLSFLPTRKIHGCSAEYPDHIEYFLDAGAVTGEPGCNKLTLNQTKPILQSPVVGWVAWMFSSIWSGDVPGTATGITTLFLLLLYHVFLVLPIQVQRFGIFTVLLTSVLAGTGGSKVYAHERRFFS